MTYRLESIQQALLILLEELKPFLDAERLDRALEVTHQGQPGVAFQSICSNLLHTRIPLSPKTFDQIKSVGQMLSFPEHVWNNLGPQPTNA